MADFDDLPDAIIEIELRRVEGGGWIAEQPDDEAGLVGEGATAPRAVEDYARQAAEYCEERSSR